MTLTWLWPSCWLVMLHVIWQRFRCSRLSHSITCARFTYQVILNVSSKLPQSTARYSIASVWGWWPQRSPVLKDLVRVRLRWTWLRFHSGHQEEGGAPRRIFQDWHLQPQGELASIFFHNTWPNPFHTSVSNCLCSIVVCQFAHGRMESGLGKKRCRQAFGTRPSPALGVLFWAAFAMLRLRLMSLFTTFWCIFVLLPPLSIQVGLLWFHDTISVSVSLSFLGNLQWLDGNGVPWSQWQFLALMRVCLLLCRLRLSKSNESTNVGVYVVY